MQKWILPSTLALVVSFCLFVFMANLIKRPITNPTPGGSFLPDVMFASTKPLDSESKIRPQIKPQQKMPPPPVREKVDIKDGSVTTQTKPSVDIQIKGLPGTEGFSAGSKFGTGIFKKSQGQVDADATPIVQITPLYPPIAARKGIEGWVKLSFSIDRTGSVTNVQVLESSPARVFDRPARKALKRWRYKAKFVGGAPVMQDNLQVQLDFTLDGVQ
jgi:protein TonB